MTVLAIDFGTSRIKAAYWDAERGEAVVLPLGKGGRLYVLSLFHVSKDGKIRFGDEAEVMLHHDPQGVVENLKLDLDKPIKYVPNGQQVKSAELMALLFRRIIDYASRQVPAFGGSAPKTLVLTLPSRWDYSDIYMDALETIGYTGEKVVIREPEAAGLAWVEEQNPKPDDMLVVLDFGGGTIDWACLRVDEKGRPAMIAELPPGGITAAGSHVDAGLLDEMMDRINNDQRREVQQRRAQVLEQIRQLKESQNGTATLSGEDGLLEVQLGAEAFEYPRELFEKVVKREVIDQAVEGIGGYLRRVARTVKSGNADRQLWCVMAGGTRLLSGLEERMKEQILEIGKSCGVAMNVGAIAQADFATVRGAVLRAVGIRQVDPEAKPVPDRVLRSKQKDVPENFELIHGGEFTMGSPTYEPERKSDETQHQVRVSDFYIGKYVVTQAEWESVTGTNPSAFKGANLPVEQVSWDDCQAFIQALNRKTFQTYRLPTEAEWEYACRAGTTTPFSTGGNLTTEQANYNGNYPYNNNQKGQHRKQTVAVDSFEPNAWGLYNMHGNVWEWCSDWYGVYESGRVENPGGSKNGSDRVIRGGSWSNSAEVCRSAYRDYGTPAGRSRYVGFRLVFVP